jgi:hypothetical protein
MGAEDIRESIESYLALEDALNRAPDGGAFTDLDELAGLGPIGDGELSQLWDDLDAALAGAAPAPAVPDRASGRARSAGPERTG